VAAAAAQIYDDEGCLFVRGRKDSFLGSFARQSAGLSIWNFFLDVKAMHGRKGERWLAWFLHLSSELPVLFGFGCSIAEYEAKHLIIRKLPNGGRVTEWVGISVSEFMQYLPGIYWLTIFGSELVEAFTRAKLESLPDVKSFVLNANQMGICLSEPIVHPNMNRRLQTESQLAAILGAQYFFDRNKAGQSFEPVPQLLQVLQSRRP
jgi:hypothetical protein